VVETTVSLYDNGSTTAIGAATVKAGVAGVAGGLPTWTATVTLAGDGTHSIVATDKDASGLTGSSAAVLYTPCPPDSSPLSARRPARWRRTPAAGK